jgi:AAA+ superfamily predicted ATPase
MIEAYGNTRDYLRDALSLLALRLHREVVLTRQLRGAGTDEAFLGLFLSEVEVDRILAGLHGVTLPRDGRIINLEAEISSLAARIQARMPLKESPLRLQRLSTLFDLKPLALEVLLLLLAPEVDNRFGRLYAYLQDDVSRRWLSPGLALRLLPGTDPDDPVGRALFGPESPLIKSRLIYVGGAGEGLAAPLLDRPLKLDDRVTEYLLEHDALDPQLVGIASLDVTDHTLDALPIDPALRTQLAHLLALLQTPSAPAAYFWGPEGSGKTVAVAALAYALNRPLVAVDAAALTDQPFNKLSMLLQASDREALLRDGLLYIRHLDALNEQAQTAVTRSLGPRVILSGCTPWPLLDLNDAPLIVHFPIPGYELREKLWRAHLDGHASYDGRLPADLAGRFRMTPGRIVQAARAAQQHAWLRDGPRALPNRNDLFEGCRQHSNPALLRLAVKVVSPYDWENLVLPDPQMAQLHAIESQVRNAHTVYNLWDFEAKLGLGKGLNALFSGPSGTGKTMAAGILAKSLGLDIYKIDLSCVVSKYIGETEKNLNRIFEEASMANVILFFDEADALFGKRSEVKDAHDRYANIEISYLLQKMEEYDGVSILATNLDQNLDEAFTRRIQFVIDFPFPNAEDRERIWRGMFPAAAPRTDDIDFLFLAAQFELAGGNIKNCVLAGAFFAAEDGGVIAMKHIVQGVAREMGKLGRPLQRADFGEYFSAARKRY